MVDKPDEAVVAKPRRRGLIIGLVAAIAVLAALGLAFVLGRQTAPGPAIVVAPGPVVEQSPGASTLPVSGVLPSTAPMRPALQASTSSSRPPAIFTPAQGLADSPGTASGYRLTRGQIDGTALARSLATTFAVSGDVGRTSTGWQVGDPSNESTSSVVVNDDPLMTWQFVDRAASSGAAAGVANAPERAQEIAASLLSGLGVDVSTVDWQVDRFADVIRMTAWQTVKGARTQLAWTVSLGRDGSVVNASGFAAGLVEIPGYPVIGAATAVRRSGLPTWATLGPRSLEASAESSTTASASPSPLATLNASGRPALRVPIADVVVTAADLGLAQFWQPDGDLLILPAYRLTGDDGSRWSLIAITGDDVKFIDVPYPTATPTAP